MASDSPQILVVDDDADFAEFLLNLLERQGFRVDCVRGAPAALRVLAAKRIDLVITDVVMPDMDGIEFLRSFPPAARGVPVIAITGSPLNAEGTLSRVMHALGATKVLVKPFPAAQLVAAVRSALDGTPRPQATAQLNQTA